MMSDQPATATAPFDRAKWLASLRERDAVAVLYKRTKTERVYISHRNADGGFALSCGCETDAAGILKADKRMKIVRLDAANPAKEPRQ